MKTAFILHPDMFELIYGAECRDASKTWGTPIFDEPQDPALLSTFWPKGLENVEAVFCGWTAPRFDQALLSRLPHLKAVFHGGGSFRPHMTEDFWQRSIVVSTAAAANAIPVAEYTLGSILLSLKRAWALDSQVRRERIFPSATPAVAGGKGSTVGLISLGHIGELVRQKLRGFDVRVIAYDPLISPARFRDLDVESVTLPQLMAESDVVSLHAPLTAETEGLITGDLLRKLKPGTTFINTARGALVREQELIEFLRERPDVQAILDVTHPEPPADDSLLYELPNVFLTPHVAGSLGAECRRMGQSMIEEFRRYVQREPLRYALSREQAIRHT